MSEKHWSLDDIAWDRFDRSRVDPELLKIAKAAALVEYNSSDYAAYLCNVFPDDEGFKKEAQRWAVEEIQHGEALGRWAQMADPDFLDRDRKSTRLNSSHVRISYAVFCLKKKKKKITKFF